MSSVSIDDFLEKIYVPPDEAAEKAKQMELDR